MQADDVAALLDTGAEHVEKAANADLAANRRRRQDGEVGSHRFQVLVRREQETLHVVDRRNAQEVGRLVEDLQADLARALDLRRRRRDRGGVEGQIAVEHPTSPRRVGEDVRQVVEEAELADDAQDVDAQGAGGAHVGNRAEQVEAEVGEGERQPDGVETQLVQGPHLQIDDARDDVDRLRLLLRSEAPDRLDVDGAVDPGQGRRLAPAPSPAPPSLPLESASRGGDGRNAGETGRGPGRAER